jgi:hypothetical protein
LYVVPQISWGNSVLASAYRGFVANMASHAISS